LRLSLLALPLLTGCGAEPTLDPLPPDAVILAFGDSLTAGNGAPRNQAYPSRLAALTGRPVVNAGVPGELSADGQARLPAALDAHRPALVLLCHGGNDILRGAGGGRLREHLRRMVETARAEGARVVLIAVPTLGFGLRPHPVYAELAQEMNLVLEDRLMTEVLSDRALKSDEVHPNAAGYARIAERLHALLRERGALE
jgi:lysophospholipase L1-like esterase